MISRVLSSGVRLGASGSRVQTIRALSIASRRLNAVRPPAPTGSAPEKPKSSPEPSKSSGPGVGVWAAAGAVLVGGLIYLSQSEGKPPQEALESIVSNKQALDDGISVIFVLGGPGAGKGTQCANLVRDYGFVHLSAGDLLRAEQQRPGSKDGKLIADYIKLGKIIPQEITIGLLKRAIEENKEAGKTKFLIDGFPRKMDQAITFEDDVAKSQFTLFFECPEEVMLKRLLKRGESSGRADDNIESIKKRFRTFIETSMPVVDYFEKENKVVKVQCDQKPEEVYQNVEAALKARGISK